MSKQLYFDYNCYGNVTIDSAPSLEWNLAYTGKYLDLVADLQNNLHRWYDAYIAKWISTDPIGFEAGDANLYRYVGNEPITNVDPEGKDCENYDISPYYGNDLFWLHYFNGGNGVPLSINDHEFLLDKLLTSGETAEVTKALDDKIVDAGLSLIRAIDIPGFSTYMPKADFVCHLNEDGSLNEDRMGISAPYNYGAPTTDAWLETAFRGYWDATRPCTRPMEATTLYALGNGNMRLLDFKCYLESKPMCYDPTRKYEGPVMAYAATLTYRKYFLQDSFEDPYDIVNLFEDSFDPGDPYDIRAWFTKYEFTQKVITRPISCKEINQYIREMGCQSILTRDEWTSPEVDTDGLAEICNL